MKVDSHWPEMMATNTVGDVKENAMHQPLLSLDKTLEVVVLQFGQVCLINIELPYTLWMTSWYYLNYLIINRVIVPLHEEHRPDFIFMDNSAPAHRGHIIRKQLLEVGVPQMERPALFPDLNPIDIGNLWDQLSRCVGGRNPAPYNLNDLRAALQEEWNAQNHTPRYSRQIFLLCSPNYNPSYNFGRQFRFH